jgi:phage shock protein PspC (stress-responsive transcriptional regulator)
MADRRYPKKNGLYRSRKGMLFGVFQGLATYFDLNVTWIRILAVVCLVITGLWPMTGIYLVAALMMKPEPVRPIENDDEKEFYNSYVHSRKVPPNASGAGPKIWNDVSVGWRTVSLPASLTGISASTNSFRQPCQAAKFLSWHVTLHMTFQTPRYYQFNLPII